MGVASEIVESMLGSTERRLGVDHPILSEQGSQEGCEVIGFVQRGTRAVEDEMVVAKGASQPCHELAAEDTAEDFHRQEKSGARSDPAGVVGRQSATGYDAMNVRMAFEFLPPSVEDGQESEFGAEVLGVEGHFEQGGCAGFKQQGKQPPLVLPDEGQERMRHAEDQVIVADGQQLLLTPVYPLLARVGLTLGAGANAARVVRDGLITAARAQIAMTTESGGTAAGDGFQQLDLWPAHACAVTITESVPCLAHDIGHLEGWPTHPLCTSSC